VFVRARERTVRRDRAAGRARSAFMSFMHSAINTRMRFHSAMVPFA
jgi:hypothetical protein